MQGLRRVVSAGLVSGLVRLCVEAASCRCDGCILQAGVVKLAEHALSLTCCSITDADASLAGCRAALEEHEGIMEAAEAQQASHAA